jgi:endonuclease/exonuclease/phosphatase family metal-dependent hydrolase
MKIKIMQYNIRTGFRKLEEPYPLEGKREELAKKIVKKENPDVLVLNEAYFESKNESGILTDYQKLFGFKYYAHGNYVGGLSPFWGCAVLSKYPIVNIKNKNKGLAGYFRCKLLVNGKKINLDVTHISPIPCLDNSGQRKEVRRFLRWRKKNYILTGDFNSLSPSDDYNEKKLIHSWSKFEKTAETLIPEMLKRDAVRAVLKKGLVDTFKEKNKTWDFSIPTNFLSKDKTSGIRIDYIFCSKDFNVLKSGIIKNKSSEQASDHYPTYAVLELK